jgi:hypothetical protein
LLVAPSTAEKNPPAQGVHAATEVWPVVVVVMKVPAGQSVQAGDAAAGA